MGSWGVCTRVWRRRHRRDDRSGLNRCMLRSSNALRVAIIPMQGPNNAGDPRQAREENTFGALGFGGNILAIVEHKGLYVLENQ